MRCPTCSSAATRCIDSRDHALGRRRRHECECGMRFTTIEVYGDGTRGGRKPIKIAPREMVDYRNKWLEDFRDRLNRAVDQAMIAAASEPETGAEE